ncbi:MAG: hypothetical protein ACYC27_14835 [Armatimonadota bacterium]
MSKRNLLNKTEIKRTPQIWADHMNKQMADGGTVVDSSASLGEKYQTVYSFMRTNGYRLVKQWVPIGQNNTPESNSDSDN